MQNTRKTSRKRSFRKRSLLNKIHEAQVIEAEVLETISKKQKTETITSVAQTNSRVVFATASDAVQVPKTLDNFAPNSIKSLKTKTHDEIATFLIETKILDSEDIFKMKLRGSHLYNAIKAYERSLQSGGTKETATEKMVIELMEDEKVVTKSIAKSVANWLLDDYIEKQPILKDSKTLDVFFKQILHADLNLENRDIETVIENSSKRLIYSFGYNFQFVGREDSIQRIENCFLAYNEAIATKPQLDKQDFTIPFVAAAPGVGKSKLLNFFGKLMWKKEYFPIYVSFGNYTSLENTEKFISIGTSLAARMVYSFLSGLVEEQQLQNFSNFIEAWIEYFGSTYISINQVLDFFNKALLTQFKFVNLKFFIAIDEVHHIDNGSNDKASNQLRQLLSTIGKYMQNSQYILLPLFAGTYYSVIYSSFVESAYKPDFISIKAFLSNEEQNQLIDALSAKKDDEKIMYSKLNNWRTNADFRHFLRTFEGLPRGIEYFLSQYLTNKTRDASTSWAIASDKLKQVYIITVDVDAIFIKTIVSAVMTKQIVFKGTKVVNTNTTWSNLENQGIVLLQPCENGSLVVYPPVLLEKLLELMQNSNLLTFFRKVFLQNSEIYWQNWEKIVHTYVYILFSLLEGEPNISLGQLFKFAKMNEPTERVLVSTITSETMILSSPHKLQNSIPQKHTFLLQSIQGDIIIPVSMEVDLMENKIFVVKNGGNASAGDILLFGLQTSTKDTLVFHYQCKWSDTQDGVISYSQIESEKIKNQKFKIADTKTRNITVIMCGAIIRNLPEQLPNDLIIVYKENFSDFFGVFSDAMKSSFVQQFIRINELDVKGLQSFVGIGEKTAMNIIEKRGKNGFSNLKDIKLDSNMYNYLLYGTNEKDQINPKHCRTILF